MDELEFSLFVLKVLKGGVNEGKVSGEYDVSTSTVSRNLRKRRVDTRGQGNRILEILIDDWLELYEEGLTAKKIAGKYGVRYMTVYKKLTDRGIEISS